MSTNFDNVIDRQNTWCIKWDYNKEYFGQEDVLPMWVADMDFQSPSAIVDAIKKRAEHGVFGYTGEPKSYFEAVMCWMKKRNDWDMKEQWLVHSPGVVTSIDVSILAFTNPGDKILIQTPVYHLFYSCVVANKRQLVLNPLKLENGYYVMDFDNLESKLSSGVKMMVFCSPHNPVGRVWRWDEVIKTAELCRKYNVLLVSDEIHSDLVYKGHKHIPVASISEDIAQNTITLISPTKTFNVAGLSTSTTIIPDERIRSQFKSTMERVGAGMSTIFGFVATEAAYRHGEEWLEALMEYLRGNLNLLIEYFREKIPEIKVIIPEGTYLVWLDCREMNVADLKNFFIKQARVGLNDGTIFGNDGAGFQRINIACPRAILMEGLRRIEGAVKGLR